ncbi:MAG: lactate/malate family dehydrogenase [Ruoffia tabacinasalis]|uniref:lactate/malate family dehydrogenase n=1 Tax=unclassified Ruoffia TaxID=2862149 RepID=UPI000EDCD3E7|nr:L-lactate dehydrogenase [Aerococcaceae bacterium]
MKSQKLGIIGVGHVGEHVLAYASSSNLFGEIVVIDSREELAFGEALDQDHATGLLSRPNVNIYSSNAYNDLSDADVIIVSATHVYPKGEVPADRQQLITNNASIIRSIMKNISEVTQEAIIIFITNPADTVIYMAANEFSYPKERMMSTGCMLDSARLRYIIGKHYNVDPKSVNGYMMGEHGYSAVPILSRLSVAGIPYDQLSKHFPDIEPLTADEVQEKVVQAAYEVFDNKFGVTNAAVAQSSIELARAILLDEHSIYPISTPLLEGEYNTERPVAFSTPTVITRQGWTKRFEVPLNEWETEKLNVSAESIRASIDLAESLL